MTPSHDILRLDLPLVLPEAPDERDGCVARLTAGLEARTGVARVHVVAPLEDRPGQLCIHYAPDLLALSRIREIARSLGAELGDRFGHLLWEVDGLHHPRRTGTVERRLRLIEGVIEAEATAAGFLRVEFEHERVSPEQIRAALERMGVRRHTLDLTAEAAPPAREAEHEHGGPLGSQAELAFAVIAGVLLGAGVLVSALTSATPIASLGLYIGAFFFGGFFTLKEAIDSWRGGRLEIDSLMLVAAAGAAWLGEWAEGALLLFLFNMGHSLEQYAMGRAKRGIEALAKLAPATAVVLRDGGRQEIAVEDLAVGDVVLVKPDERLPADGFVIEGISSVDQSPVTGESVPVDKRPVDDRTTALAGAEHLGDAHRVFAGTVNGRGALEIVVTRIASETTLARVVQMVTEAETQKSPTQRFTQRFERIFVPAVLSLVGLLLFAWAVIDEPFSASLYRAMAVLVAASPCALAISTPSAVLSAVARAARAGVLVKGGAPLENLGTLTAIAFDKTGTLTEGSPRLTDVVPADGVSEAELLAVAVAVEELSDHPLARAVVRDAKTRVEGMEVFAARDVESLTGLGVRATVDDKRAYIGKDRLFGQLGVPSVPQPITDHVAGLEASGRTTVIVSHGDRFLGVLGLMDRPRPESRSVIKKLRSLGIARMTMLSGDNQRVADAVAAEVGIDEAHGDLLPEQKVDAVERLRVAGAGVAMVGDGVNDAPAMATATVGIAMGAAGSDVALETADIALMADDLDNLPFAVGLSRQTTAVIRQNLWASLGVVALLVPATVLGLGIGPAVAFHEGSTLLVVVNALRLLGYKSRGEHVA